MGWERVILERVESPGDLPARLEALFDHQRSHFALLRLGERSLSMVKTKDLVHEGARIVVQANPGRRKSTHAKVDAESVSRRPCFLCPDNIPRDERGISFGEFVILPNPYPVLQRHCTIPVRDHMPQSIGGRIGDLLVLAAALGPEMLVFYNGARCGASAPDHFHLQACRRRGVPLFEDPSVTGGPDGISSVESFARRLLVFTGTNTTRLAGRIQEAVEALGGDGEEPMFNLLASFEAGRFVCLFFPRRKHRPACYFTRNDSRLAVSPAALEMAGVLVVAEPDHFDRLDELAALKIYDEVSMESADFERLLGKVE